MIQGVLVTVSCPACGASDQEFEFDPTEVDSEISMPCEECSLSIAVSIGVFVQQRTGSEER